MEIHCTRPGCPRPQNQFADLDDNQTLKTVQQKYCITCGMPLILVGRYLPVKLLGRGGFGAAFLARDRYTPAMRKCVVKQFQPAGDLTPQQLEKAQALFEREGEVLEQLGTHPQIPDLYAFFEVSAPSRQAGKQEKYFYLVQELIDGQTLEEQLAQKGRFSETEVLALLREILPVLQFVHDRGSIHRDIKPSNIMRHQNGTLFLLDFGAVKKAAAGTATGSSTGIYSQGFAPPEQMSGGQVYPSTDLYALAVTCIQLLTGKPPTELFDAFNNQWSWRNYAQTDATLAEVLDRMLVAAPNQRWQSATEVLEALNSPSPVQPSTPPVTPTPLPPNPPSPVSPPPPPSAVVSPSPTPAGGIPQPPVKRQPRFAILEVLASAGFTGFEGGLLFITLNGFLGVSGISIGILGMVLGGLIFAQYRRILEGKDLPILAGITLALVLFVPALHQGFVLQQVLIVAVLAGASAIAVTALFRLIYQLLSRFL
jgi:serine/threonine-protein kinase